MFYISCYLTENNSKEGVSLSNFFLLTSIMGLPIGSDFKFHPWRNFPQYFHTINPSQLFLFIFVLWSFYITLTYHLLFTLSSLGFQKSPLPQFSCILTNSLSVFLALFLSNICPNLVLAAGQGLTT
jgi:hypothetical protein